MQSFTKFIEENVTLEYHDILNPVIWNPDLTIKQDIRNALLKIADKWIEICKIPPKAVKDIFLTGGNANFNYTPYSDLDLHVWTDLKKVNKDIAFVSEYMATKKSLWEDKNHLTIKGYKVEAYTQPLEETSHVGQGVFSLKQNRWIQIPEYHKLDFEHDAHLARKVEYFENRIDNAVEHHLSPELADKIKDRIKTMRGAAIHKGGEFSFENLVFKSLRNSGYLDKLSNYIRAEKNKRLSLEQYEVR